MKIYGNCFALDTSQKHKKYQMRIHSMPRIISNDAKNKIINDMDGSEEKMSSNLNKFLIIESQQM